MLKKLNVPRSPCTSCPYRRDTPAGVWDASEYAKLPLYDESPGCLAVFLCHHFAGTLDTVCRGWLSVHQESIAARLAVLNGEVTAEELYAEVREPLYKSGTQAAKAGMKGVRKPSRKALKVIERLERKRGG